MKENKATANPEICSGLTGTVLCTTRASKDNEYQRDYNESSMSNMPKTGLSGHGGFIQLPRQGIFDAVVSILRRIDAFNKLSRGQQYDIAVGVKNGICQLVEQKKEGDDEQ